MAIHVPGFIALLFFYTCILAVGLAAYFKKGRKLAKDEKGAETITVARRDIGWVMGAFTMTAIWSGGGYMNGLAEIMFTRGLVGLSLPLGNNLGLAIAGLFFAKPMRERKYVTMLDPFEQKYGKRMAAVIYLPAFVGDVMWVGGSMAALGSSVSVILELEFSIAVIISMAFCVSYVVVGGIYAVTWTDIAELFFIIFGLVLCTPFIWNNTNVHAFHSPIPVNNTSIIWSNDTNDKSWLGTITAREIPSYIDLCLMSIFGAVPWQDYFQRVLCSKSGTRAQILSYIGAFASTWIGVPAVMIGLAARYTDWNAIGYGNENAIANSFKILPLCLEYLTPKVVAFFGIGTISAAVMSGGDAGLLSIGGMFAHNIYRPLIRPQASNNEMVWVLRVAIVIAGIVGALLAIYVESVMAFWYFACDLVYVVLFPQLLCVLFIPYANTLGALAGYLISIIVRFLAGEASLKIPTLIKYPLYNYESNEQGFPIKTFAMLLNLTVTIVVSYVIMHSRRRRQRVYIVDHSTKEMELGNEKTSVMF